MNPERGQESTLQNWLSLALLILILCRVAPLGFAYALVASRPFWWACFGAGLALGANLLAHH